MADFVRRGFSYQQIAEELGCTRNAISGIVHRNPNMQLERPSQPVPIEKSAPSPAPARLPFALPPVPQGGFTLPPVPPLPPLPETNAPVSFVILTGLSLPPEPKPEPQPRPIIIECREVPFMELTATDCKWIISNNRRGAKVEEFLCCGELRVLNSPYCAYHTKVAWRPK